MSYYKGDYMGAGRGDYYRGDPGFLSFLGKAVGTVGSFIPGVGGTLARLGGKIAEVGGGGRQIIKTAAAPVIGKVVQHPVLSAAGAAGIIGMGAGVATGRAGARGHPVGRMAGAPGMRRRRRMRVTNPKALRRAIRRTTGFAKLAMRTIHLIHPRKKARFGGFRRRRTRK